MADQEEPDFTIHVNGKAYPLDVDDLEVWEVEFIEDYCNVPIEQLDLTRMKTIRALTWVIVHRSDPSVTFEDIGRIKMGDFGEPKEPAVNGHPTAAPAAAPKKKPAAKRVPA